MQDRLLGSLAADEAARLQKMKAEKQIADRAEQDEGFAAMAAQVKKMKKSSLVKELEKRSLDTSGKQTELINRLLHAIEVDRFGADSPENEDSAGTLSSCFSYVNLSYVHVVDCAIGLRVDVEEVEPIGPLKISKTGKGRGKTKAQKLLEQHEAARWTAT